MIVADDIVTHLLKVLAETSRIIEKQQKRIDQLVGDVVAARMQRDEARQDSDYWQHKFGNGNA